MQRTDEDGRFRLTGVPPGPRVLRVDADGEILGGAIVDAPARDVLLLVGRQTTLRGRIDVKEGSLDGFVVEAWPKGSRALERRAARVDADGRFLLTVAERADYLLVVWNEEHRDDRYAIVEATTGREEPVLELVSGEHIAGTVQARDGTPVPYAPLFIDTAYGHRKVRADHRGRFFVPGLPAGQYSVHTRGARPAVLATGAEALVTTSE